MVVKFVGPWSCSSFLSKCQKAEMEHSNFLSCLNVGLVYQDRKNPPVNNMEETGFGGKFKAMDPRSLAGI